MSFLWMCAHVVVWAWYCACKCRCSCCRCVLYFLSMPCVKVPSHRLLFFSVITIISYLFCCGCLFLSLLLFRLRLVEVSVAVVSLPICSLFSIIYYLRMVFSRPFSLSLFTAAQFSSLARWRVFVFPLFLSLLSWVGGVGWLSGGWLRHVWTPASHLPSLRCTGGETRTKKKSLLLLLCLVLMSQVHRHRVLLLFLLLLLLLLQQQRHSTRTSSLFFVSSSLLIFCFVFLGASGSQPDTWAYDTHTPLHRCRAGGAAGRNSEQKEWRAANIRGGWHDFSQVVNAFSSLLLLWCFFCGDIDCLNSRGSSAALRSACISERIETERIRCVVEWVSFSPGGKNQKKKQRKAV
jgi:hypothetical protein